LAIASSTKRKPINEELSYIWLRITRQKLTQNTKINSGNNYRIRNRTRKAKGIKVWGNGKGGVLHYTYTAPVDPNTLRQKAMVSYLFIYFMNIST